MNRSRKESSLYSFLPTFNSIEDVHSMNSSFLPDRKGTLFSHKECYSFYKQLSDYDSYRYTYTYDFPNISFSFFYAVKERCHQIKICAPGGALRLRGRLAAYRQAAIEGALARWQISTTPRGGPPSLFFLSLIFLYSYFTIRLINNRSLLFFVCVSDCDICDRRSRREPISSG